MDRGVDVLATEEGGFVVVGVTASRGAGGEDAYLMRLNEQEKVLWQRTLGGTGDDNGWSVIEAADTPEGGLIVGGFTTSEGAGGNDCSLWAVDQHGLLSWSKTFGGERNDRCWDVVATIDSGYLLAGETDSFGAGERDCYLVRTDSAGKEVWSKTFGGEADDRCFSVANAADGGFVVAGQTYSYGAGDRDAWILKLDQTGTLEWSKTHGGAKSDVAHSVVAAGTGSFLVTGYTTSFAASPDDPMVLQFAADGSMVSSQVLEMPGHNRTLTGAVAANGGLCLVGFTIAGTPLKRGGLVVRTDKNGDRLWTSSVLPTTEGESLAYGVTGTVEGGCAITGHTTVDSGGEIDLLFARFDREGRMIASTH